MQHIFLINPAAGRRDSTSAIMTMAQKLGRRHGLETRCILTQRPGHALETCRAIAQTGEPVRFYACGGDGTVNEVANGIWGVETAAMTCIPAGTGNDLLKNFHPACRPLFSQAENLWNGPQVPLDAIHCNDRCALTVACCGFDAQIAADVHTYGSLLSHRSSYIASLAVNFFLRNLGHRWRVTVDGKQTEGDFVLLAVCNGRYYGGGFQPMPEARMDDGILNALLVWRISRVEFLRFVGPYARGEYRRFPQAAQACAPREILLESAGEDIVACLDGEILRSRRVLIRLSRRKVNFFGPAGFLETAGAEAGHL